MTTKIGFIGLGIMGRPMALNLRKRGYALWVHGRRPVTMQDLVGAGATPCHSAREVAANADVIITMVSDSTDVESLVHGENGLLREMRPGKTVVDMSTISPAVTRRLARDLEAHGAEMLDAPVSGGETGAVSATLSIMVGGKADTFERVKPIFECLGKNIVHVGDNGAGQVAKACNQVIVGVTIAAVSEALTLARRSGVDPAKVRAALLGGFAGSKILEVHGQRMLDNDFKPGFKAQLHQKDIRIVLETAHQLGLALPATALVAQELNALVGSGEGEFDSSAIVRVLERMSGSGRR
jgi:2-hydroxy-3-oxopropionate reductase